MLKFLVDYGACHKRKDRIYILLALVPTYLARDYCFILFRACRPHIYKGIQEVRRYERVYTVKDIKGIR